MLPWPVLSPPAPGSAATAHENTPQINSSARSVSASGKAAALPNLIEKSIENDVYHQQHMVENEWFTVEIDSENAILDCTFEC